MRQKQLKVLSLAYLAAALISFIICFWDVIFLGLFAPAVDMTHGIGVAMVCTLGEWAMTALLVLIALDLRKKFTAKTLKMGLLLIALSVFTLIFCLIGSYNVIPSILGLLLPGITVFFIR